MEPLWLKALKASRPGGVGMRGFTLTAGEVFHRCLMCDMTFPQTDDGWQALNQHGFDAHEQLMHYDWRELHGKQVTIAVVEQEEDDDIARRLYGHDSRHYDLIARTDDGTIYFLPEPHSVLHGDPSEGGFKCKPKSHGSNLKRLMPRAAESALSG